jgi:two-component system heavy metal sensor histidine kinase CusS
MLRRAITNLLSNAVRYSPAGAAIRVRAIQSPREAKLTIENPAEARSPEDLRRLFTRFERGAATQHGSGDGTGLGLSIVESIMRLHGGRIVATSGAFGIRFELIFPLREAAV